MYVEICHKNTFYLANIWWQKIRFKAEEPYKDKLMNKTEYD